MEERTDRRTRSLTIGPLPIVVAAILAWSGSAGAEAVVRSVEVVAEVRAAGRTPEQARQEALQRAREAAVAEVAGIHVAAQQLRLKSESDGELLDRFSYLVHTSASGRIVDEKARFETRLEGETPVYRVTLRADVALEPGSRDPGFEVTLETRPASRLLRAGEPLALRITASRDCFVTVLDLQSDGSVRRLFPNPFDPDHRVGAGHPLDLPRADGAFELRATASTGSAAREHLLVVATLDPVTFEPPPPGVDELAPRAGGSDGLTALNRWLLRIPVDRRVEVLWDYEVLE